MTERSFDPLKAVGVYAVSLRSLGVPSVDAARNAVTLSRNMEGEDLPLRLVAVTACAQIAERVDLAHHTLVDDTLEILSQTE